MTLSETGTQTSTTIERALTIGHALGATVAGYVPASCLKDSPSAIAAGRPEFSPDTGSILVLGLFHDSALPELDWCEEGKGTPGDRILHHISNELVRWFETTTKREACNIPYQITAGGIYLKDAAVLAGLGIIGRNNLVLVPGLGPQVRFRALWVDIELPQRPMLQNYNPCQNCAAPCNEQCPCEAFVDGRYVRERCLKRIDADKAAARKRSVAHTQFNTPATHCRICEVVCPAGNAKE